MLNKRLLKAWAVFFVTLGGWPMTAPPAWGSPPGAMPLGVQLPWRSAAEADDVTSVFYHHAGLGLLSGWDVGAGVSADVYPEAGLDGVALGLAGRLGPVGLGLGLMRLEPVDLLTGTEGPFLRFDLGLGVQVARGASIGFGWAGLFGPASAMFDDVHSIALSATWRPHHLVSIAAGLDRLNAPRVGGAELAPLARLDVGVRPGTERLNLSLSTGVSLAERPTLNLGFGLHGLLASGVSLGLYVQAPDVLSPDRIHAGLQLKFSQSGVYATVAGDARQGIRGAASTDLQLATWVGYSSPAGTSLARPDDLVVRVRIRGPIAERSWNSFLGEGPMPFAGWLRLFDAIGEDPRVKGVLLDIEGAPGWAQCWELRQAVERLKVDGKRVHAFVAKAGMRALYLASSAHAVHMDPAGVAYVQGLSATRLYYAGLLAKIGVKAQFVRWEDYKSYPESFTREGPTDPSKEQTAALLGAFDASWRDGVGKGRGLEPAQIDAMVAASPLVPSMAVEAGLVDSLAYDDELLARLRSDPDLGAGVNMVDTYRPMRDAWSRWGGVREAVAVIPVVGSVVDGRTPGGTSVLLGCESTGDVNVVDALEEAMARDDVVGIVVRVASPGGAVLASDRMHRAVERAAKSKPLVVSFGDVAASGGYYLATHADRIVSSPVSITGSIGIFAGKVDLSGLYEMAGVGHHTEKTTDAADAMGMHRPWSRDEEARARARLKVYYERFLEKVATGRGLSLNDASERARGRVYAGSEAEALGLVDASGSLWDAIEWVRSEAGFSNDRPTRVVYLPQTTGVDGLLRSVLQGFGISAGESVLAEATPLMRAYHALRSLGEGEALAAMPYTLEVR